MSDPINDASTAIDEPGWGGGGVCIDTSGDFMHLPKEQRTAAKERRRKWRAKLRRADEIRATWSESDFESERQRLEQEVQNMLAAREEGRRDAA